MYRHPVDQRPQISVRLLQLLADYEACLVRAQMSRTPIRTRKKEQDISRILYCRGQELEWDVDELYAAFSELDGERVTRIRRVLRERSWHLMDRENRLAFLEDVLPEMTEYYDLFTDFRAGGFRVLGDLICDADDENTETQRRQLYRESDSEAFITMMRAYENRRPDQEYNETIAEVCRELLCRIAKPKQALRYVVAAKKRNLLWDLLPEQIAGAAVRRTEHD